MHKKHLILVVVLGIAGLAAGQGTPASQRVSATAPVTQPAVPEVNCVEIHALPVQYAGRVMPLDTAARELILEITGKRQWQKYDPVMLVLSWTWQPQAWRAEPIISVDNWIVRKWFDLPADRRYFSYEELAGNEKLAPYRQDPAGLGQFPPPAQVDAFLQQLSALERMFAGRLVVFQPAREISPADVPSHAGVAGWGQGIPPAQREKILSGWDDVRKAFVAGDKPAFIRASSELTNALRATQPAGLPDDQTIKLEVLYNILRPFQKGWWCTLLAMSLGLIGLGLPAVWPQRIVRVLAWGSLLNGFSALTLGIVLRWKFAGHAPVATMYESLVFMGWGVVVIGIVMMLVSKMKPVLPIVAAMATAILVIADTAPLESTASVLVPVLRNTMWLTFHVQTIMLAYSAFALTMGLGHVQAVRLTYRRGADRAADSLGKLLYGMTLVGCVFLTAGILFGAVWANESWGHYWTWDPKETWSLITLLGYMVVLHGRRVGWFGAFGLATASILGFLLVIMTYYGVNLLGRGLHAYAAVSGGLVWVGVYVLAEMAFMLVMWGAHSRRRKAGTVFLASSSASFKS